MVEVSAEIGFGKEEIELDLGLSIGGSFRRPEKERPDSKPAGFQPNLLEHSQPQQKKKRWMMIRECGEAEEQQRGGMSKRDRCGAAIGGGGSVVENVEFDNIGFGFRCWTLVGNKKNVVGSGAPACSNGGFQPFLVQSNGGGLERNDHDRNGVNASSMCSSSVVLEHQSSSLEGGGSSDSHSVHSLAEPTLLNSSNIENNTRSKPEQSASSHPVGSKHDKVEGRNNIVKEMQPNITPKKEVAMDSGAISSEKPFSNENPSNGLVKETKNDMGKPPKPLSQTSSLPQMPYVSTTGNDPNGKTVNGFLYKYTKSEVSIVCVCHGSTFSPAEFVQHAGGTDVSHPLRHITVIPSAFG